MRRIYPDDAFDTRHKVASYWEATASKPVLANPGWNALSDNKPVDVAIIGGGFTGQNAALELARQHGMQVAILEAGDVGWGASGRNGGFCCLGGAKLDASQIARRWGQEQANAFLQAQVAAIQQVRTLAESEQLEIDISGQGEMYLAHRPRFAKSLATEAAYWQAQGTDAQFLNTNALQEQGYGGQFHAGLHVPIGFGIHPLKYVYALYTLCLQAGVHWLERSPVTGWTREQGLHRLYTPRGSLLARKVIIATNGYTPDDLTPALDGRLLPALSSILVTRPLTVAEQKAQGWHQPTISIDSRTLLHYFRLLPDGRFLFGGRGGVDAANSSFDRANRWLRQAFDGLFPAWKDVEQEYFWRGFVCLSRQRTPHIGQQAADPDVFHALAYHGSGVAMGSWAGKQVAHLLAGAAHQIPAFMLQAPKAFPLPALRRQYLQAAYWGYQLRDELL